MVGEDKSNREPGRIRMSAVDLQYLRYAVAAGDHGSFRRAADALLLRQGPVPVVNQIRTYWWCSPPRIGRQRKCPASSRAREIGASFSKDKCVRISL